MKFIHVVVSTLDISGENFVWAFQSKKEAVDWACDFLRRYYHSDSSLMALENGDAMLEVFTNLLGIHEWFFVLELVFHRPRAVLNNSEGVQ